MRADMKFVGPLIGLLPSVL